MSFDLQDCKWGVRAPLSSDYYQSWLPEGEVGTAAPTSPHGLAMGTSFLLCLQKVPALPTDCFTLLRGFLREF